MGFLFELSSVQKLVEKQSDQAMAFEAKFNIVLATGMAVLLSYMQTDLSPATLARMSVST